MTIKISKLKCEECQAEFETIQTEKKPECPGCNSQNTKEISAKEIEAGCGSGCEGCGHGCN